MSVEQPPARASIHAHFKHLGQVAPGFAGVFFDENGDLTVSVATDTFSGESLGLVLAWARATSPTAANKTTAKIRRVRFDFLSLSAWYALVGNAIRSEDGFNTSSIDETRGVLRLGFSSLANVQDIRRRLDALGVPGESIEFELREPAVPEASLNQKYRPAVGGLQIQMPGNPGPSTCTLAFNILKKGEDGYSPDPSLGNFFLTASHCSGTRGVVSGLALYQHTATAGNRIGVEVDHADTLSGAACPPSKSPCQLADVLVGQYDDSVNTLYLRVADVNSSKTITGYFNLQGSYMAGGLTGEVVTKVGQAAGKSTGTITATCVDKLLVGIWLLCEQQATYSSAAGDSGAPVFIPYSPSDWSTPRLVGIHSSAEGSNRFFAPMSQIDYALNHAYYWY